MGPDWTQPRSTTWTLLGLWVLGERSAGSPPQGVNNYGSILLATYFETPCRLFV